MKNFYKKSINDLAIFGGAPLFDRPRPIGQLSAPPASEFLMQFKKSFDSRMLTNNGPAVTELEKELRDYHGVNHCVPVVNAATGIMILLNLFSNGETGDVIIPSFSYRGLPYLIEWAGNNVVYCDVDPVTHTLSPDSVENKISENTTSILLVANFNHAGDISALSDISEKYNVPLFMDSVNALGCTHNGKNLGANTRAEVFSLHATKVLNGFEGGYITTNDGKLASRIEIQRNFGFASSTVDKNLRIPAPEYCYGINGKLNEMHAAMALASISRLDEIIQENRERYITYNKNLSGINGISLFEYGNDESYNYQTILIEFTDEWLLSKDDIISILRKEGALATGYYSPPLHQSVHSPLYATKTCLPVSEKLSGKYIQMPCGEHTSREDIELMCSLLEFVGEHDEFILDYLH